MKTHIFATTASLFLALALVLVLWFELPSEAEPIDTGRLTVVTTIYPLADFVKNVGGDLVDVTTVVPAGTEPHDYEPSPRAVASVLEADVLVYLGGGLDTWAEDVSVETAKNGGHVLKIEDRVPFFELDPHIWLDPVAAQDITFAIRDVLISADPEHEQEYRINAEAYTQSLKALHGAYMASLDQCRLNDIIVSHDAFGYLARRYTFNLHAVSGLSPEAEPSARDLTMLATQARTLGIQTVFFETLVSPKLAETLAQEIGATAAVLNPLEGLTQTEVEAGEDYLSVMDKNREALSSAMLCQ